MASDYKYVYIYLKRNKDTALLRLYLTLGVRDFNKLVKDSLRVLTRPGYIPTMPVPSIDELADIPDDWSKTVKVVVHISKKDEDVVRLLNDVQSESIGSFVLEALKFYIGPSLAFNSRLVTTKLETVPFYTPNGVIVFSNSASPFTAPVAREQKQKKIATINAAIAKKEEKRKSVVKAVTEAKVYNPEPMVPLPVTLAEEAPVSEDIKPLEQPTVTQAVEQEIIPSTPPVAEIPTPAPKVETSVAQSIPSSSAVFAASEFGFEEQSGEGDEDDILALLEGLM